MNRLRRGLAFGSFVALLGIAPPPHRPAKPDFGPLAFLVGSWTCTRTSPEHTVASHDVFAYDESGFWLVETETMAPRPWAPFTSTTIDRITYDSNAGRWIDLASRTNGSYTFDTSNGFVGNVWAWHHEIYSKTSDVDTMDDFVLTKVDERHTEASIVLVMKSGEKRTYARSCHKDDS